MSIDDDISELKRELADAGDRARLAKINPLTVAREILEAAEDDDLERWAKATAPDGLRRLAADYIALLNDVTELQKGNDE